ncbi:MAG: RHS repeat-associated core domain-containing protein [Microcystis aeruginosa G11-01]|nr:RHS repeat-associated core domain-containing protein [Microcystis aeruginosa G11-01]
MSYTYDNVGNVLSVTDSINGTVDNTTSHQFDALNRMTVNSQGNKRVDYTYNAISQVTNKKRYSDSTGTNLVAETNHTYDTLNRLTNITHSKGATNITSYTQTYDAGSKITRITSKDGSSTYTYDNTDQLVGADYNYQTDENYTYDANGNRTNTGYVTGVNNQLLSDSKYSYGYDAVGNRSYRIDKITNEVTYYSWDIRDRLTGIRVINALGEVIRTANYVYDVYDQRIAKIVDLDGDGLGAATTERFVYGSNQNIALVFDGNGTLTHRYLFANGIDQIEADEQVTTGTTLWALTDHLGSVRDVVDNSGVSQNHIVYDAFGNITSQSNSSVVFRNTYTGQEFDPESGLFSYGGRYYDPFNGKFIQEDKIGFKGKDTNLSRYVGNNSINYTDPKGTDAYDILNKADQFFGSFSRVVTFGATDIIRENFYGDKVNNNQTGTFANLGTGAGVVATFLLGAGAPSTLARGASFSSRLAQGYTAIGSGIGSFQSTTNIINGCATPLDALSFAPAVGFASKNIFKFLDGIRSRTIFRAVSNAELDDIANFGFRPNPNGRGYETGKLFAPTIEEAAQFGKNNYRFDSIPNTIVKVEVPNRVLKEALTFTADRMTAISIPTNQLNSLKGKALNYNPYIK